jgi:hypothetical protein
MQNKPSPLDFEALLAFHKATFGDATMSTPAGDPAAAPAAQTVSDVAGGGIIVGADPRPTPTFTPVAGQNANSATINGPIFTAEQIAKARQEEKDKLYPELQSMKSELAELKKARDEQIAAEKKAREEAEAALEAQRQEELTLAEKLEEQKREFETRFQALQQEREQERQVLQMERQFQELQAYKAQAVAANAENIIPELANELTATNHSSREEIDAHIARLVATSSSILESMQAAVQAQRQGMRGAPVTAPPAGPLDTYSGHDSAWEAAQNGSLSFEDYVKNRDKLLSGVSRNTGLYG